MPFTLAKFVRALLKGVGHRYIKRIPYMTPKGQRYRYIYKVEHTHRGKHAFDEAHLIEGTKFALHTESGAEFHGHITAVDGNKITYTIDDGPRKGEVVETTKAELAATLNEVHGYKDKLSAERAKVSAQLEQMKQGSATEKQIARVRRRLLALGGVEKEAVTPEPESRERSAVKKKAAQMLAEVDRFKEIAKQEPRKKYKRLSASKGDYSAADPDSLYRAIRDNIKNVRESGDYTHAKEQISMFLASRALNSEHGYLLNRLLREINPLDQTPEQLRAEEAEEERFARDDAESDGSTETSVLVAFHDLEASREKEAETPEPEAETPEPETKTPDLKALREKVLGEFTRKYDAVDLMDSTFFSSRELSALRRYLAGKPIKPISAQWENLERAFKRFGDVLFGDIIAESTEQREGRKADALERRHELYQDLAEFLGIRYDDPRRMRGYNRNNTENTNRRRIVNAVFRRMKIDNKTTYKDMGEQLTNFALQVERGFAERESVREEARTLERLRRDLERRGIKDAIFSQEDYDRVIKEHEERSREIKERQEAKLAQIRKETEERIQRRRELLEGLKNPELEDEPDRLDQRDTNEARSLLDEKDYLSYALVNPESAINEIASTERPELRDPYDRAVTRAVRLFAEDTRTGIKLNPEGGKKTRGSLATFSELQPRGSDFAIGYNPQTKSLVLVAHKGPFAGEHAPFQQLQSASVAESSIAALDILDALRAGNAQEILEGLASEGLDDAQSPNNQKFREALRELRRRAEIRRTAYGHSHTISQGKKIHELKDTIRLEGLAARPHVQSDSVDSVSAAPRVSGFEDLSAKDLKGLTGAISAEMSEHPRWGATMSGVMRDGDILGTTDGKNIVFMKTRGSQEDRTSTDPKTGQQLEGTPPPFVQAIPESNPVMTLDRSAIKALSAALVGVKGKGGEEGFYVDLDLNGDAYDISVGSKGGKKYTVASIPASDSGAPKFRVNPQYLKAALARAGDKASLTIQGGRAPLLIEGESGLNTIIMGITRVD